MGNIAVKQFTTLAPTPAPINLFSWLCSLYTTRGMIQR
ncbi:MAG: hypothetical protein K0R13_1692 [Propionibacteriaceae bacterium]|jgi:hypothetical protein|nr:hypothetical protein [Propionibacteriaceae bacterium]MDF2745737.1 hypothetical protein [Propionibacteriaceae bacterium]